MSITPSNAQARNTHALARSATSHADPEAQGENGFPTRNFYNDRPFGGVSRHQLELLKYANLQVLMILARD